jgi:formimidoylglutamate deiminase
MPLSLFAANALTAEGWQRDVRVDVSANGTIAAVHPGATAQGAERAAGPLLPGMPNLHSHAFQRAIAGRTGRAGGDGDSFWTWRAAMYGFLERVDADAFGAIAAQAYVEMLKGGYTRVAEFHYVHHDPKGKPYDDPAELARRVVAAAATAGIALTLLPVFYAHAGFGGAPPAAGQRRFVHSVASYTRVIEALANDAARSDWNLGVAPHSLRATMPDELTAIVELVPSDAPIHIHAAEQQKEVADCIAWSGARPVAWLLDHARVDARWCVVHATHMTADETRGLAASGAVAGLAPTTEADLGDGTFAAIDYLRAGGTFGVGSDSNTVIDPYAELRQLEWSQRLATQSRNVLAAPDAPVGQSLYVSAARGGARATAVAAGAIAPGRRADFVVLDGADPALTGQGADTLLDAAIFGPCRKPVRDVMVGGRWVVRDGHHADEDAVLARYRSTIAELLR